MNVQDQIDALLVQGSSPERFAEIIRLVGTAPKPTQRKQLVPHCQAGMASWDSFDRPVPDALHESLLVEGNTASNVTSTLNRAPALALVRYLNASEVAFSEEHIAALCGAPALADTRIFCGGYDLLGEGHLRALGDGLWRKLRFLECGLDQSDPASAALLADTPFWSGLRELILAPAFLSSTLIKQLFCQRDSPRLKTFALDGEPLFAEFSPPRFSPRSLLRAPALAEVVNLSLGNLNASTSLWPALSTAPCFANLQTLIIDSHASTFASSAKLPARMPRLRSLTLHDVRDLSTELLQMWLADPATEGLEVLSLTATRAVGGLDWSRTQLPRLRELCVDAALQGDSLRSLTDAVGRFPALQTVRLYSPTGQRLPGGSGVAHARLTACLGPARVKEPGGAYCSGSLQVMGTNINRPHWVD